MQPPQQLQIQLHLQLRKYSHHQQLHQQVSLGMKMILCQILPLSLITLNQNAMNYTT